MNKPNTATSAVPARRRAGAAVTLAFFLLSGCEYLGPAGAKKLPIPPSLVIQDKKANEEPPVPAVNENRGATKTEIYPPSGALFGAPPAADKELPGKPAPPPKEGKYNLSFEDADVAEVAQAILHDYLKTTCVVSPKVTGKITIKTTRPLTDDELIPTLEMLLKANGAVLVRDHSIYRVEPDANATVSAASTGVGLSGHLQPGFQLRVVPLRYVGVAEMQKVIEPLMPPKSVVRADEARNLLLLAGTADELENVLDTIRIFDVDFMRGMSVGLFPLKNVEALILAEELDKLLTVSGKGPLAGMFRILPIERLNSILVVTQQPRYLDEAQTWIERLDRYNTAKTGNMHVYRVQNVDALELANTLSNIFGQGQGGRRTPGASLAPGLTGSSVSGGSSSGFADSGGSSGFGGSSQSGFGGSSSSGFGGSSTSSSGLGSSSPSGMGSSSGLGSGGAMGSTSSSGGLSGSGTGRSSGGGFAAAGLGQGGQGRNRGSVVTDLGNNVRIVADPASNALIIMAKAQEYRDIEAVIKQLDTMPLQVLVDATIVEVALTDELQYGLQWYFTHRSENGQTIGMAQMGNVLGQAGAAAASGGFSYTLVNMGKNLQIELNALAASNKINVLSTPSLMVMNNQQATIRVGDQVPILTAQALPTTGTTNLVGTQSIQYKDTGVLLDVRPRVNAGGLVTLELEQAVDNVKDQTSGAIQSPTIAQRRIRSSVAVKSGETIVLGGLIIENITNGLTGMPLLSQLPWLGSLFSQTNKKLNRSELVVMMTPRVVENAQGAQDITNEFRRRLGGLYEQRTDASSPVIMEQGTHILPPPEQGTHILPPPE